MSERWRNKCAKEPHRAPLTFPTDCPCVLVELGYCKSGRSSFHRAGQLGAARQASRCLWHPLCSLALAWFLGTQTGLTSSSAAESLISRKVELLESRGSEAWAEGGLFQNTPLPYPPASHPCLRPELGSSRLMGTPLSPPSPEGTRSSRQPETRKGTSLL